MLNFKSNLGAYGHNLLAYERDARGCKFAPGCKFALGSKFAPGCKLCVLPRLKLTLESNISLSTYGPLSVYY